MRWVDQNVIIDSAPCFVLPSGLNAINSPQIRNVSKRLTTSETFHEARPHRACEHLAREQRMRQRMDFDGNRLLFQKYSAGSPK
jgi:hypothetical protein